MHYSHTVLTGAGLQSSEPTTDKGAVTSVQRWLEANNITPESVTQLRSADPKFIRKHFTVVVERTINELNGISCLELEEVAPDKQQIISSRSFGQLITRIEDLEASIASHVSRGVEKLRNQQSTASLLTVFIRTNPFRQQDAQYRPTLTVPLIQPCDDVGAFQGIANYTLHRIYREGYRYKKAGIMLSGIQSNTVRQA